MGKKGRKGKKDVFQRFADTFLWGNRALAQTLFWIGIFTVPPVAIGALILFDVLLPQEKAGRPAQGGLGVPSARQAPAGTPRYQTGNPFAAYGPPTPRPNPAAQAQPPRQAAPTAQPPAPRPQARPAKPAPPPGPPKTGKPEADAVIAACYTFVRDAEATLPEIDDLAVRARAQQTIAQVKGIQDWLVAQPETAKGAQRLADYYLPTTLKLLRTYISVDNNPGPNAQNICKEIDRTLEKFNDALATLQNDLLDSTALDVSAEIRAMENMLGSEGLVSDFRIPTPGEERL